MRYLGLVLLLFGFLSCSDDNSDIPCTYEAIPGLKITLVDTNTSERITNATIIVTDGDYQETLIRFESEDDISYVGAYERAGSYTLTITADNYQPLNITQPLVVMNEDECHVATTFADYELTPL